MPTKKTTTKKTTARRFVLCPHCQAKSSKQSSCMGGLETRRCKNGHVFEWDRWIGSRGGWNQAYSTFKF